jgi:hypothetical protein
MSKLWKWYGIFKERSWFEGKLFEGSNDKENIRSLFCNFDLVELSKSMLMFSLGTEGDNNHSKSRSKSERTVAPTLIGKLKKNDEWIAYDVENAKQQRKMRRRMNLDKGVLDKKYDSW